MSTPEQNIIGAAQGIIPTDANGVQAASYWGDDDMAHPFLLPQSNEIPGMKNILPRDLNCVPVLGGMAPDGSVVPFRAGDIGGGGSGGGGSTLAIQVPSVTVTGSHQFSDPYEAGDTVEVTEVSAVFTAILGTGTTASVEFFAGSTSIGTYAVGASPATVSAALSLTSDTVIRAVLSDSNGAWTDAVFNVLFRHPVYYGYGPGPTSAAEVEAGARIVPGDVPMTLTFTGSGGRPWFASKRGFPTEIVELLLGGFNLANSFNQSMVGGYSTEILIHDADCDDYPIRITY